MENTSVETEMLTVRNISAYYGNIQALDSVSIKILAGEIVSLLGANGAGKTTTLKVITGQLKTRRGEVRLSGRDITGEDPEKIANLGLTMIPEGRKIFPELSVRENLKIGYYTRRKKGSWQDKLPEVFEIFPVLEDRQEQSGGTLSGGEQQMLAIARGLMAEPRIMLLDEPSLGLAPMIVKKIFEIIKNINQEGTTILLVEQNANLALKLADRAYILETGRLVHSGPARELSQDEKVREAYLGSR